MIKEIDGYPFRIIFKNGGNDLFCEGCMAEYSWELYDADPEYFIEVHKRFHPYKLTADSSQLGPITHNIQCDNCGHWIKK